MTKQEEIREGLQKLFLKKASELSKTGVTSNIGKDFMEYLHSRGVVIKVDCPDCKGTGDYFFGCSNCNGLGYIAVEPLIKE